MSFRAARPTSTTMVLLLICGAALPAQGKGQTFVVRADGKNIVRFTSRALLETIDGRTGQTKGSFRVNPKRLSAGLKGTIEVDLTSLKTGIAKRDKDMQGPQYLETDKHPTAVLILNKLTTSKKALIEGEEVKVKLGAELKLRGISRDYNIKGVAQFIPFTKAMRPLKKHGVTGDAVHFRGSFMLKFEDHGITRPQFLAIKLADRVKIHVDIFGFVE